MILHQRIEEKYSTDDALETLATLLGYTSRAKGRDTLHKFIKSHTLAQWLSEGRYDYKYDAIGFVRALASVLEVDIEDAITDAFKLHAKQLSIDKAYIEIGVNFRRTTESVLLLMGRQRLRYVPFDKSNMLVLTDSEIFTLVGKSMGEHYRQNNGSLKTWGKIEHYIYLHTDGEKYLFDTEGIPMNTSKRECYE